MKMEYILIRKEKMKNSKSEDENIITIPLSPLGLILLAEKNNTIGIITTPTILAPIVDPILAKVAIFSRSLEFKDKAGIIDQNPVSLNE